MRCWLQFHGMVEQGHEARLALQLNGREVAHAYDKAPNLHKLEF